MNWESDIAVGELEVIYQKLGVDEIVPTPTTFGYVFEKGNFFPPKGFGDTVIIDGKKLRIRDRVLHERVLVIYDGIPERDHPEEDQELVTNIGLFPIEYIWFGRNRIIAPEESIYTVNKGRGHRHGFRVKQEEKGRLYVAKMLFPKYAEGNSFTLEPRS